MTWQEMAAISTVGVAGVTIIGFILANHSNIQVRLKALEIEVTGLKEAQEKTDSKFDRIMDKLESISIALSNKVDKHNS